MRTWPAIWGAHIRYALVREMMFKANFLVWIIVEIAWLFLHLMFIEVVYSHVDTVAGWNKPAMLVLIGTNHAIQQIFQAFFLVSFSQIPELIRTGRLDFYLLKPVSTQFLLSVSKFDAGALINALIGFALAASALPTLATPPSAASWIAYLLLIPLGVLIHYALMLLLISIAFWIIQAESLVMGYYSFFSLARIPREAFRGTLRIVFTWAVPLTLVANVPASALLGFLTPEHTISLLIAALLPAFFATLFFSRGLRAYCSASS